jgi:hypothetical protein
MKTMKEHKAKREKKSLLEPLVNHKGKEEGKKERKNLALMPPSVVGDLSYFLKLV